MPRPLKRKILGASTIILSKDIDKYTSMCGLNFYEPDINKLEQLEFKLLGFRNMQEKLENSFIVVCIFVDFVMRWTG